MQQWVRRKNIDTPCEADAGPTASIRCPHGGLLPEQATGAKRALLPETLWLFIYDSAIAVKPDDMFGCMVFPSNSEPCAQCSVELTEVTCLEDSLRFSKHVYDTMLTVPRVCVCASVSILFLVDLIFHAAENSS